MIVEALRARLPLITVESADPRYCHEALAIYTKQAGRKLAGWVSTATLTEDMVYVTNAMPVPASMPNTISTLESLSATLVVVGSERSSWAFHAGMLPTPKSMLVTLMTEAGIDGKVLGPAHRALHGLTITEAKNILALSAATGSLDPTHIMETRQRAYPIRGGLDQVRQDLPVWYRPDPQVVDYISVHGSPFLSTSTDPEIRPRGLLLRGLPGTGKTSSAMWMARRLGIPLYRVDMSSILDKYLGVSEQRMDQTFTEVEQSAPCILLFDEIEKLFGSSDEEGTTKRLLSTLLWWLQEQRSQVLTVMTCNNFDVLPKELYRPGRLDTVLTLEGVIIGTASMKFCIDILSQYGYGSQEYLSRIAPAIPKNIKKISQAELWGIVKAVILALQSEGGL